MGHASLRVLGCKMFCSQLSIRHFKSASRLETQYVERICTYSSVIAGEQSLKTNTNIQSYPDFLFYQIGLSNNIKV